MLGGILSRLVEAVCRSMVAEPAAGAPRGPTLGEAVMKALDDLRAAERTLDFVTDPDLIDQAIYTMEASRKRYSYLLNRLRESRNPQGRAY